MTTTSGNRSLGTTGIRLALFRSAVYALCITKPCVWPLSPRRIADVHVRYVAGL